MSIPIFSVERDDQKVMEAWTSASQAIQLYSPITPRPQLTDKEITFAEAKSYDLFPIDSILVTASWNGNDEFFDKAEVWQAKDTPVDKPFNIEHKPRQIIGHMTGTSAVDREFNTIPNSSALDELPDEYHIISNSVIYRHLKSRDEDLEKEAGELIEQIQAGEWFVSMECLFHGFDYKVGDNIVQRNASTAHLTKYLRAYGGKGVYENQRIGRIPRNIIFSGVGLVKKPANKESIIFATSIKNCVCINSNETLSNGDLNMAIETVTPVDDKQLAAANQEIASLRERLEKAGEEQHKAALASLQTEVDSREKTIAELQKKIDELTAKSNELAKSKETLESEKTVATEQLKALAAENQTMKLQSQTASRVSTLVDKGVDKIKAEEIVAKFNGLSDEQFGDIVEVHAQLVKNQQTVEPEADPNATVATTEVIEDAEPEADATLASGSEDVAANRVKVLSKTLAGLLKQTDNE